ncbi:MAG: polysaccharide deacetylase family protein [Phycisphaeraceae bacterium]|nr:polysaccharide deacetylase family protein [Phycisphaeraceae bacterium]
MTRFIAAYDTERLPGTPGTPCASDPAPSCVQACEAIVAMHRRHRMPATFFIVGQVLEASLDDFRRLLDDPLFEIASHSYSHQLLRNHPFGPPAVSPQEIREQIHRGKEVVDRAFPGRQCIGFRPAYSFVDGLCGQKQTLQWLVEAGFAYVSSMAWGPDYTLPAPLRPATSYADDGFADLAEYPCHGWHENVLKSMSKPGYWTEPRRLLAYPPLWPEAIPPKPITTAAEEFRYNSKVLVDRAKAEQVDYVTPIWHPWSLGLFDPAMEMLDLTFRYVREQGLTPTTFAEMHTQLHGAASCR